MNGSRTGQDDDWLVRSMSRYENLYMFELPQPTKCIEWSQLGTAICVAGCVATTETTSTEITQLALPEKLLPSKDETHWAKRDFRLINGALSRTPITSLKHLLSTDTLASSGGESVITLWRADQLDTDCLKETGKLQLTLPPSLSSKDTSHTFIDISIQCPNILLTALSSSLCTVQTLDMATAKPVFMLEGADEALHGLAFVPNSDEVFMTCSGENGRLQMWDSRNKVLEQTSNDAHPKLALLCGDSGEVTLYDIRDCKEPFARCMVKSSESVRGWFRKTQQTPCIKFSEGNSNLVSVSGCTTGVSVYDISKWTTNGQVATPIFTHTGHEDDSAAAQVFVHSWQPDRMSTILSADSDGSLHAWQWKDLDSCL
ncbi:WD repeat-containing protein 73-like isoform X2 [Halichondria panicea]|uniref:WD repeat-containing protein 73-like isoform X2 n=1 Tax=Halichondria panicea TaxID=6063 RepID=UPI00312B56DB